MDEFILLKLCKTLLVCEDQIGYLEGKQEQDSRATQLIAALYCLQRRYEQELIEEANK